MWWGEGEKEVGIIGCREQGALIQMTIQLIISYSISIPSRVHWKHMFGACMLLIAGDACVLPTSSLVMPTLNMKNASLIFLWVKIGFREDIQHIYSSNECKDDQVVRRPNVERKK